MASRFHLIVVGKLKNNHIQALEEEYLKRLTSPLIIHEVKSHGDEVIKEEKEIMNKVSQLSKANSPFIIILTEHGQLMTSKKFSTFIDQRQCENKEVFFIIGGSCGFRPDFLKQSSFQLSLSPMILPHKLARLIFIEQFYRAQTILAGHPYSH